MTAWRISEKVSRAIRECERQRRRNFSNSLYPTGARFYRYRGNLSSGVRLIELSRCSFFFFLLRREKHPPAFLPTYFFFFFSVANRPLIPPPIPWLASINLDRSGIVSTTSSLRFGRLLFLFFANQV